MFHVELDDEPPTFGCPTDTCGHLATVHEPEAYTADGAPIRPICVIPGCPCGDQWVG